MKTDTIQLLEASAGEAWKWTTFLGPYRNYDWSKWVFVSTVYQLTVCALCYTAYVSSRSQNFDVIPMYGVVQLAILYTTPKVFEGFARIKLLGVLIAILGLLQVIFVGFITHIGHETIRSVWRDYCYSCGRAPDSDACLFEKFYLGFVCVILIGWELFGAFYLFAVYEAIKQEFKKGTEPSGQECDV